MKPLAQITAKKSSKRLREQKVLLGMIEHYLKTGKPVGSNTLKEEGFEELSSATIRNYFACLEKEGYLTQQHASGGRIPTDKAFRLYAQENIDVAWVSSDTEQHMHALRNSDTQELSSYLSHSAELLGNLTNCAVFMSAPKFDQDFIVGFRVVLIDQNRCVCVIITNFGLIQSEILQSEIKLTLLVVKRVEAYFHWRLTGHDKPENLEPEEEYLAKKLYSEVMVRWIVGYSNFADEAVFRTGFAKLLNYPDFHDVTILANSLALFENVHGMRLLLKECCKQDQLKVWIGEDLAHYSISPPNCAVLAIPYHINKKNVGAIGILGPVRMRYKQIFGVMRAFAENLSEGLTRNIFKFKISFRQPDETSYPELLLGRSELFLLEDKR